MASNSISPASSVDWFWDGTRRVNNEHEDIEWRINHLGHETHDLRFSLTVDFPSIFSLGLGFFFFFFAYLLVRPIIHIIIGSTINN